MTIKIWGISDNRVGHLSQIQSVLDILPYEKKLFILNNNILGKIGYAKLPLGVRKEDKYKLKNELKKLLPNVILVIGRRNLSVALYLKRLIKLKNSNVKLIFLMPPGSTKYKDVDLYFIHRYKVKNMDSISNRVVAIDIPPSKLLYKENNENYITEDLIDILNIKLDLGNIFKAKKPYIGVLIGGKAKGVNWNINIARLLCNKLNKLIETNNGTLIVTTSRRTGSNISDFIKNNIPKGSIFWKYNNLTNYNPYIDIITKSDALVVTGESTSMIADCITLNLKANVLIFDDTDFKAKRFQKFRDFIYHNNYAVSLKDGEVYLNKINKQNKLNNTATFVANTIKNVL